MLSMLRRRRTSCLGARLLMKELELAIQSMKILVLSKLDESLARGSFASCHDCEERTQRRRGNRRGRKRCQAAAEAILQPGA